MPCVARTATPCLMYVELKFSFLSLGYKYLASNRIDGEKVARSASLVTSRGFLYFVNRAFLYKLFQMKSLGVYYFLVYLFQLFYMFRATCAHHQENLLYLCDIGIFHSVWVDVWSADQAATHTQRKSPVSHRYSKFS